VLKTALKLGYAMDALRVWPRVFVSLYFIGMNEILNWYLSQPALSWDKSAFAGVYASLCLPLLKWYMENGVDWGRIFNKERNERPRPPEEVPRAE